MKVLVVRELFTLPATDKAEAVDYPVGAMIQDGPAAQAVRDAGLDHHCTPTEVDDEFFVPTPAPRGRAANQGDDA